MPIPTRSLSLREPRKQHSSIGRAPTGRTISSTASPAATSNENVSMRNNKSLLPVRDDGRPTRSLRFQQPPESRLPSPQKGPRQDQRSPERTPATTTTTTTTTTTGISRRQSLVRPSPLKTPSSARTTPALTTPKRAATFASGSISPSKQDVAPKQNGRPLSPKKTTMPPPARPTRLASLRQPASSSAGTPATPRGHMRHRSQVTTPGVSQVSKKIEPPQPSLTTPRSRANFSTYQQQFSPKKTVKQSPVAPSPAGPPDLDPSLLPSSWPEIAALQIELLQLSLLHSSSLQQSSEWERNAERQLRTQYDSVAKRYRGVIRGENESQRRLNGQALQGWLKNSHEHNGRQGFAEQVQVLSQVAQETCDLYDSRTGRYTLVVREFEAWFQKAEEIKAFRLHEGQDHIVFIDPLDDAWKERVYAMAMRLELCSRQLESLDILGYGEVERLEDSALLRIAKGLDDMVGLMVEELSAIRKIEADIVRSERQWVSQLTRQLSAARPPQEKNPRLGMWRQAMKS